MRTMDAVQCSQAGYTLINIFAQRLMTVRRRLTLRSRCVWCSSRCGNIDDDDAGLMDDQEDQLQAAITRIDKGYFFLSSSTPLLLL